MIACRMIDNSLVSSTRGCNLRVIKRDVQVTQKKVALLKIRNKVKQKKRQEINGMETHVKLSSFIFRKVGGQDFQTKINNISWGIQYLNLI